MRNREIESQLIDACQRAGLRVISIDRSGHIRMVVEARGVKRKLFFSGTPSDVRSMKNFRAQARRKCREIIEGVVL